MFQIWRAERTRSTIAGPRTTPRRVLGGAVLGPDELAAALGFDPLAVLTAGRARRRSQRLPFSPPSSSSARADGEMLVLRVPRDPRRPAHHARAGGRASAAGSTRRCTRASATAARRVDHRRPAVRHHRDLRGRLVPRPPRPAARHAEPSATARRTPCWRRSPGAPRPPAPPQRDRDRLRHAPLAPRPRRAPARRRLGLVAQRRAATRARRARRVRRRGPRRHRLLARRPLRHARRLPAALTPALRSARRRALLGHRRVYFVTIKRPGLRAVLPSRRASAPPSALTDDQQRVHVLERARRRLARASRLAGRRSTRTPS